MQPASLIRLPDVPIIIKTDEQEFFSGLTWKDLYHTAVSRHIPYLYVVILEVSSFGRKFYRICEGTAFSRLSLDAENTELEKIVKTYAYAIPCFILQGKAIIPSKLKSPCIPLHSLFETLSNEDAKWMMEGMNVLYPIENYEEVMGHIHYIVGHALSKLEGKRAEELIWLWCSARHNLEKAQTRLEERFVAILKV